MCNLFKDAIFVSFSCGKCVVDVYLDVIFLPSFCYAVYKYAYGYFLFLSVYGGFVWGWWCFVVVVCTGILCGGLYYMIANVIRLN